MKHPSIKTLAKITLPLVCALCLSGCAPDIVSQGTTVKVLDLVDQDTIVYSGSVQKGNKVIFVTVPDDYTLPKESTLRDEFKDDAGQNDEALFLESAYKNNKLIKFKMTPSITMSSKATLSPDSELQNDKLQVFSANTYLSLVVLNGTKKTSYKVYVGTAAQLSQVDEMGDVEPDATYITSFDLFDVNKEQLSRYTVITHQHETNNAGNLITIVLPVGTPRIISGISMIGLAAPNSMTITPFPGPLPDNFEPAVKALDDSSPADSITLEHTYTVHPRTQTVESIFARTYTVVLKRSNETGTVSDSSTRTVRNAKPYANSIANNGYLVINGDNSAQLDGVAVGDTVTIQAVPVSGYAAGTPTTSLALTLSGSGPWTFIMPNQIVTVSAAFSKESEGTYTSDEEKDGEGLVPQWEK
jgi:hypothetical protein